MGKVRVMPRLVSLKRLTEQCWCWPKERSSSGQVGTRGKEEQALTFSSKLIRWLDHALCLTESDLSWPHF